MDSPFRRAVERMRRHGLPALGFVLVLCLTRGYYLGDTLSYARDVEQAALGASPAASSALWEFGHLLWRPLGRAFWGTTGVMTALPVDFGPMLAVTAFFIAVSLITAILTVLLWHSLALEVTASRPTAFLVAFGFACTAAFLTYSHSGTPYVPGLCCVTLAVWFAWKSGPRAIAAGAVLTALAALLWFPYVLSAPGVLFASLCPWSQPFQWKTLLLRSKIRDAALFGGVLLICLGIGFGVGAAASGAGSMAEAKQWASSSSHGWSQSNRALRLATGLPRSFLYMGRDGILYKRFLRKDPFAPVTVSDLLRASLWKIAVFNLFLLCLAWELVRRSSSRWATLALLAGSLPVLAFAVFLFEPGSPERYFPAYPFLVLAVAWVLRDVRTRRVAQLGTIAFLLCAAVVNLHAMNRWRIARADEASMGRILPLKAVLEPGSLIAILSNQDDLSEMYNRNPFSAVNRPEPVRLYDILEPATLRILTWRREFAAEALNAWKLGGDVWVSKRLWGDRPRPAWNWVEGDDSRIDWRQAQEFFLPLNIEGETGGEDGFFRLAPSASNRNALKAAGSLSPSAASGEAAR